MTGKPQIVTWAGRYAPKLQMYVYIIKIHDAMHEQRNLVYTLHNDGHESHDLTTAMRVSR